VLRDHQPSNDVWTRIPTVSPPRRPVYGKTNVSHTKVVVANKKGAALDAKPVTDMPWGAPTWRFLHCLCQKITEYGFSQNRVTILGLISAICTNLPCPICAEHAKAYLMKCNFHNIRSKGDLKEVLFTFHNHVNKHKGYAEFTRDQLETMYTSMNFVGALSQFVSMFKQINQGGKFLAVEMFRTRLTVRIQNWFNAHLGLFEPATATPAAEF
jgi:Erv1 / Alr family